MNDEYTDFIARKAQYDERLGDAVGIEDMPDFLFPFQRQLVSWSIEMGRSAIFADCGLGKTAMQLAWANHFVRSTNKSALILTPLSVGAQTVREANKFGIDAVRSRGGEMPSGATIVVANYEQLHKFSSVDFCSVVCDESSCIKDFKSKRKDAVVEFLRLIPFRLLCTATAAPNDYWELGTSSEALGLLGFRDMITTFFKQETSKDHLGWGRTKYRFRGHAEEPFWNWVCSWARSMRRPSDLGFSDDGYILPKLIEREFVVDCEKTRPGMLFSMPGKTLNEQRAERRNSISERCDKAAEIANGVEGPVVCWCELNDESKRLTEVVDGAKQVTGSMQDEEKEEILTAFSTGQIDRLVTKPKIGAWGLNWQHCSDIVSFPSHSYEQYYQSIRRCYRFGQESEVNATTIVNEGECGILDSLKRKASQAETMFSSIVNHMHNALHLMSMDTFDQKEELPEWL